MKTILEYGKEGVLRIKGPWTVILTGMLSFATAAFSSAQGTPQPSPSPSAGKPQTPTISPTPVSTPLRAPTWAPTSAGLEPGNHGKDGAKKVSPWMSLTGLGLAIPASPHFQNNYGAGLGADVGTGYRLSDRFSLWFDLGLSGFGSQNSTVNIDISYTVISAALSMKYRFTTSALNPYLFAGPGLAYNEVRNIDNTLIDTTYYYLYIPVSSYEFDFFLQGGAGLELELGQGAAFFLQAKALCDFTSASFAGNVGSDYATDSPTLAVQVELGTLFGL